MASSKTCFKCGARLPICEFYKHRGMADGHLNKCKSCTRSDVRNNRSDKIDYYRECDRARGRRPERIRSAIAQTRKWRAEDARRSRCHSAVARAIAGGLLEPKSCEHPGCSAEKTVAHHENYDQPLVVVWYCQPHHKARHAEMDSAGMVP